MSIVSNRQISCIWPVTCGSQCPMAAQSVTRNDNGRSLGVVTQANKAVERERRLRGWSVREAARHGGVSNTTWGDYEKSGILTAGMQQAIVRAFDWAPTWAEDVDAPAPAVPDDVLTMLVARVEALHKDVLAIAQTLHRLSALLAPDPGASGSERLPGRSVRLPPV